MGKKRVADFKCCGIRFTSARASALHSATYHEHGLKCQICDNNFSTPSRLRKHQIVHFGKKEFVCNICNFATLHKSNLKRHVGLHERGNSHSFNKNELKFHGHWTKNHKKTDKTSTRRLCSSSSKASGLTKIKLYNGDHFNVDIHCDEHDEKRQTTTNCRVSYTVKNQNGGKAVNRLKKEKCQTSFKSNKAKKLGVEKLLSNSSLLYNQQKITQLAADHAHYVNEELDTVQDEARQIRLQASMLMAVSALLPLLERLLELSASIAKQIPKTVKIKVRLQAIECLEYLLHTIRMVIVRWEKLIGLMHRDASLTAIQYVYGTLPIFTNWEKNEHLEVLENILLLIFNTVKKQAV